MEILALLPIVWILVAMMSGRGTERKKESPHGEKPLANIFQDINEQRRYDAWLLNHRD